MMNVGEWRSYVVVMAKKNEALTLYALLEKLRETYKRNEDYYVVFAVKNILQVLDNLNLSKEEQDFYAIRLHVLELDVLCSLLEHDLDILKDDFDYKKIMNFHKRCEKVYCSPENIIHMAEYLEEEANKLGYLNRELIRVRRERERLKENNKKINL